MTLIYTPEEDSFLFVDFINKYFKNINRNRKFLDMGCGSCIISESLRDLGFKDILCADINKESVLLAEKKGFRAIKSDLFEDIDEKFDYILFNPPYLPSDIREDEESKIITTGGRAGDEIILEFLGEASKFLKKEGEIFLLISSLTPIKNINKYKFEIVASKKIFLEELFILKFKLNN